MGIDQEMAFSQGCLNPLFMFSSHARLYAFFCFLGFVIYSYNIDILLTRVCRGMTLQDTATQIYFLVYTQRHEA